MLQGRLAEAETLQRKVVAKLVEINGPDSYEVVEAEGRLGETLRKEGRAAEALPLHRKALEHQRKLYGEDHVMVALAEYQLAADLIALGRAEDRAEARRLLRFVARDAREEESAPPPPCRGKGGEHAPGCSRRLKVLDGSMPLRGHHRHGARKGSSPL